jgi:hypothetical protein
MPYFGTKEGRNFIMHAGIAMLTALNVGRPRQSLPSRHVEADGRHP